MAAPATLAPQRQSLRPRVAPAPGVVMPRDLLLGHAAGPTDPATLAVAGTLAAAFDRHGVARLPLPGLDAAATEALMAHWFPGADRALGIDWSRSTAATHPRSDEIEDVTCLLVEAAAPGRPALAARWLAHVVACGCLGSDHLWQDLQLRSRQDLSDLLSGWFPALAARNTRNMKWKKFFYKQLCERAELRICKSPSCEVCTDYAACFGPEETA
jgi:nitrogen fixation protein NifQ